MVVAMVCDARLSGIGESLAARGTDGAPSSFVFVVWGDVADCFVESHGVVVLAADGEFGAQHGEFIDQE